MPFRTRPAGVTGAPGQRPASYPERPPRRGGPFGPRPQSSPGGPGGIALKKYICSLKDMRKQNRLSSTLSPSSIPPQNELTVLCISTDASCGAKNPLQRGCQKSMRLERLPARAPPRARHASAPPRLRATPPRRASAPRLRATPPRPPPQPKPKTLFSS